MTPTGRTTITTSDGERLEAQLHESAMARAAVVISHPHPLHGGDMHTPVPAALFAALPKLDLTGVRFNFRGVGQSTGQHDNGTAEQLDVRAALDAVSKAAPGVPIILAGWSFGADVSLAVDDDRVAGWFLAASVLRVVDPETMAARSAAPPKRFVIPENDQFAPPSMVEPIIETWTNTSTAIVAGDHFFGGVMQPVVAEFGAFIDEIVG